MTTRARIERVRASAGIAQPGLQQIADELTGRIDAQLVAAVLRDAIKTAS